MGRNDDLPRGDRDEAGAEVQNRVEGETALAKVRRLAREQGLEVPPEDEEAPSPLGRRRLIPYEERLDEIYRKDPGQEG